MATNCPACNKELTKYKDDICELEIDSCFYCHGLWFDRNELRNFFSAPKLFKKFRLPEASFKVKINDAPPVRQCPRCSDQTLQEVHLKDLTVDECSSCQGIWLDSGELNRLCQLHKSGELKGKSEVVKQIKKGHFDQGVVGQATKAVALAFKGLF